MPSRSHPPLRGKLIQVLPGPSHCWEGDEDRFLPQPCVLQSMTAPGKVKGGGMGMRMMVDVAQKASRLITGDALAGMSLLLPAPPPAQHHLPVVCWTILGSPANAAATSRGWGEPQE